MATTETSVPLYLFLYQKQLPEDRSNTAITNNTMQAIEEARRSKGEEEAEAEAKEKKKTAF
jgi:hypothetical protein